VEVSLEERGRQGWQSCINLRRGGARRDEEARTNITGGKKKGESIWNHDSGLLKKGFAGKRWGKRRPKVHPQKTRKKTRSHKKGRKETTPSTRERQKGKKKKRKEQMGLSPTALWKGDMLFRREVSRHLGQWFSIIIGLNETGV